LGQKSFKGRTQKKKPLGTLPKRKAGGKEDSSITGEKTELKGGFLRKCPKKRNPLGENTLVVGKDPTILGQGGETGEEEGETI